MRAPLTVLSPSQGDAELPSVLSYFAERRVAGWIGVILPPIVLFYDHVTMGCVPSSISASYYTCSRDFFVGALCAVGVFLFCSIGYKEDKWWSVLAGVLAVVVAFCPTSVDKACMVDGASGPGWTPDVHGVAACALFLVFTYFCLRLFTRTKKDGTGKVRQPLKTLKGAKKRRNFIYLACGSIMLLAIAVFAVSAAANKLWQFQAPRYLTFAVEWVCLWTFGLAWLVKGQQLFRD